MKYGMNLLLWTGELHEAVLPALGLLKQLGYDGVEVPVFNTELDYVAWGRRLDDLGLERTGVTFLGVEDNPISPDAATRRRAIDRMKRTLDCCAAAGCATLAGPYHSAYAVFTGRGPTTDEWAWGVDTLREVAQAACTHGITLGLEALNRHETYLLNTLADTARFCRDVSHPNCHPMYDTYHGHFEESSPTEAIAATAGQLHHVHISENHRGLPGAGQVRWTETFDALEAARYDGWLVVEAFGLSLPELAAATRTWRATFPNDAELAAGALAFMQTEVARRRQPN